LPHRLAAAQALHGIAKTIRNVLLPVLKLRGDWLDLMLIRSALTGWSMSASMTPTSTAIPATAMTTPQRAPLQLRDEVDSIAGPNRYALGKLGRLVGLPDEGKGQVLYDDRASHVRFGLAPKGNVILLIAEDDISDTIVLTSRCGRH
jgi:hypothetical protein